MKNDKISVIEKRERRYLECIYALSNALYTKMWYCDLVPLPWKVTVTPPPWLFYHGRLPLQTLGKVNCSSFKFLILGYLVKTKRRITNALLSVLGFLVLSRDSMTMKAFIKGKLQLGWLKIAVRSYFKDIHTLADMKTL